MRENAAYAISIMKCAPPAPENPVRLSKPRPKLTKRYLILEDNYCVW